MSEPRRLPLEAWGRASLARLQVAADKSRLGRIGFELLMFGIKQGWACMFGGVMLSLLFLTAKFYPHKAPLARYDFLVLAAVAVQILMLYFRLESFDEAKVILAFHVVGTVMELFKTSVGSWIYPEASLLRIGGVPLFSGFMYSAVGSFIARSWRIMDLRFENYPPLWTTWVLAGAIYVNFFAHHWLPDIRVGLFLMTAVLFWRCRIWFKPDRVARSMPLLVGFFLVALFIWFAENIGTFSHAWIYPSQHHGWTMVSPEKLGSWLLLMIISFVLVSLVRIPTAPARSVSVVQALWPVSRILHGDDRPRRDR
jgi:uncharacterized membrane protein YoaT (DUF817 family)